MLPSQLFQSASEPITDIAKRFADLLNVPVTRTAIVKAIEEHPDYPSLLSMSDVLTNYGILNITFTTTAENLHNLPVPFVVQVKEVSSKRDALAIVSNIHNGVVDMYSTEKQRWEKISMIDFIQRWPSGITLVADAENATGEKEYEKSIRAEKRLYAARAAAYMAIPFLSVLACGAVLINNGVSAIWPVVFTLFTLVGCVLGALLLAYEIDQYNPLLKQICSAGKKVNCGAVLNTKAAKIAGISWSSIGFTYFTGSLLTLLFNGITNNTALFIVGWLNVLALPYVLFSVYYQWRVVKQWCVLCVGVQAVLVLQCITALLNGSHEAVAVSNIFSTYVIVSVIAAYLLPFIIVSLLIPAWQAAKESRQNKNQLQRLKHDTQIFESLIGKQKAITESTDGLGIMLGNPNASYKLIKVCNPYCGPCAMAHKPMEELLENNPDVQLQIIFTAPNEEGDQRSIAAGHLLAIAEKQNEQLTIQALDDWYMAKQKNYEVFAGKYPLNGELKQQGKKMEAMWQWCLKTEIAFTPTFFVNGHQLPAMYSVDDLKYFLSV